MLIQRQKLILVKEQEIEYTNKITSSMVVFDFIKNFIKLENEPEEVLYLITITSKNNINSFMEVARGSLNSCYVNDFDIYKRIFLSNCRKFILVHNHPSGDPRPSKADIEFTEKIKSTSNILKLDF